MKANEEKLYILKLDDGVKEKTESSFLNPRLGFMRIKDAEKNFAAEYYIDALREYKKQLDSCSNNDKQEELLYYMNKLAMEYITYSPKEFLSLHHLVVEEYI